MWITNNKCDFVVFKIFFRDLFVNVLKLTVHEGTERYIFDTQRIIFLPLNGRETDKGHSNIFRF